VKTLREELAELQKSLSKAHEQVLWALTTFSMQTFL
jgi:hypothetical protein